MIKRGLNFRLSEKGKIKIGYRGKEVESTGGKKFCPPKKLNYFVVTTTERLAETGNFAKDEEVMAKLPPEPKELKIRLPFDDIDLNFHTSFAMYKGNKCVCRGDGEKADCFDNGVRKQIVCDPENCPHLQKEECKPTGILSCFLAECLEIGAVYKFRTHSWYSVSGIGASLLYLSGLTKGILQGLPLVLKIVKKTTEKHGVVTCVTIVLDVEMMEFRKLAIQEMESRKMLSVDMRLIEATARESGFGTDTDLPEDIQGEFYPEHEERNITPGAQKTADAIKKKKEDIADRVGNRVAAQGKKVAGPDPEKPEPPPPKKEAKPEEPLGLFG